MKKISTILSVALACTFLAGCGQNNAPQAQSNTVSVPTYQWDFVKKNDGISDYKKECDQKGTVTTIEYDTPAYAVNDLLGLDETLHKKCTVYLPYGYDESKQYNILYLMHGTEGESDGPMEEYWLVQWGDQTTNVLHNMIKEGLCEPTIVVCPTYYSRVEGHELTDTEAKALGEKLSDSYMFTEKAEDGGTPDNPQNIWPVYFGQELRNNIIPTVEKQTSHNSKWKCLSLFHEAAKHCSCNCQLKCIHKHHYHKMSIHSVIHPISL